MKIYNSIEEFKKVKQAVVTIGTFDGVHIGHLKIISSLRKIADDIDGETVLLTFSPHPRIILFSDTDLKLINTKGEIAFLENAGIDHLIIHPFSREFSRLSSVEFVRDILVNKIAVSRLVIGYNHHFGRNREGSFEHLKSYGPTYGFEVEEICAQDVRDVRVSSTKIRKALEQGDIKSAKSYLTYDFPLTGIVVKGKHFGHQIGFPTANIKVLDENKLIPSNGVYAVRVMVRGEQKKGILNIGVSPTLDGSEKTIEVHIIDFDQVIYGEQITILFDYWIRAEQKFESIEALKEQLIQDKSIRLNH